MALAIRKAKNFRNNKQKAPSLAIATHKPLIVAVRYLEVGFFLQQPFSIAYSISFSLHQKLLPEKDSEKRKHHSEYM